jgi:hypothetical protein
MDPRLHTLLRAYLNAVDEAAHVLLRAGLRRPTSPRDWYESPGPTRSDVVPGWRIRKHTCGAVVTGPEGAVDLAFGDHGELDGLDLARVAAFWRARPDRAAFADERELLRAWEAAVRSGALTPDGPGRHRLA